MTAPSPTQLSDAVLQAIRALAVDWGVVTQTAAIGGNALSDNTKEWPVNIHRNRLVKIIAGLGAGQQAVLAGNVIDSLITTGAWTRAIAVGDTYVILERDLVQEIADALGGGVVISAANPLPVISETALDNGVATGGTANTLIDTTRGWQVNIFEDAIIEIVDVSTGISYMRTVDSNTATVINFATNPLPAAVVAGDVYSIRRMVNPLSPINKGIIHNVAGYIAAADILAADAVPTNVPTLFKVMACFNAAGILSVQITNVAGGGGAVVQQFQGGVALNVNSLYGFTHLVHTGDTINYQYSVNATIMTFRVVEIPSAI